MKKITVAVTPEQEKAIKAFLNPNKDDNGKYVPGYTWGVIADYLLQWPNHTALECDLYAHLEENDIEVVNAHNGGNNIHCLFGETFGPYLHYYRDARLLDSAEKAAKVKAPWVVRLLVDPRKAKKPYEKGDRSYEQLRERYQEIKTQNHQGDVDEAAA